MCSHLLCLQFFGGYFHVLHFCHSFHHSFVSCVNNIVSLSSFLFYLMVFWDNIFVPTCTEGYTTKVECYQTQINHHVGGNDIAFELLKHYVLSRSYWCRFFLQLSRTIFDNVKEFAISSEEKCTIQIEVSAINQLFLSDVTLVSNCSRSHDTIPIWYQRELYPFNASKTEDSQSTDALWQVYGPDALISTDE